MNPPPRSLAFRLGACLAFFLKQPALAQPQPRDPPCYTAFYQIIRPDEAGIEVQSESGERIQRIDNGALVLFLSAPAQGTRVPVALPGGAVGYVEEEYLAPAEIGGVTYSGRMQVKTLDGGTVNVRRDPSLEAPVIDTLADGTWVTEVGFASTLPDGTVSREVELGEWSEISSPVQGFVARRFLVCASEETP